MHRAVNGGQVAVGPSHARQNFLDRKRMRMAPQHFQDGFSLARQLARPSAQTLGQCWSRRPAPSLSKGPDSLGRMTSGGLVHRRLKGCARHLPNPIEAINRTMDVKTM